METLTRRSPASHLSTATGRRVTAAASPALPALPVLPAAPVLVAPPSLPLPVLPVLLALPIPPPVARRTIESTRKPWSAAARTRSVPPWDHTASQAR
ncbi:hypothetical protein [Streptosporangium vulgare]|uniref:hypothetical protein n=1 Tax=Streptosporangium vulgare TaxID=46190 RepID=UPI0031DC248D